MDNNTKPGTSTVHAKLSDLEQGNQSSSTSNLEKEITKDITFPNIPTNTVLTLEQRYNRLLHNQNKLFSSSFSFKLPTYVVPEATGMNTQIISPVEKNNPIIEFLSKLSCCGKPKADETYSSGEPQPELTQRASSFTEIPRMNTTAPAPRLVPQPIPPVVPQPIRRVASQPIPPTNPITNRGLLPKLFCCGKPRADLPNSVGGI